MQALGIQEKEKCLPSGKRGAALGPCTPFIFRAVPPGELQKVVDFTGTLAWHPGPWTWWSLGAVGDEFSA